MKTAGIDIGTTTISGVVLENGENGQAKILEAKTVENGCFIETGNDWERIQYAKEIVERVACLPYDVMNSVEAAEKAKNKPESLLHVTRAEIDLPAGVDVHSNVVYDKAVENFNKMQEKGWLVQDEEAKFYIYAQTMEGRTQYGIVACASYEDYWNGIIKKQVF